MQIRTLSAATLSSQAHQTLGEMLAPASPNLYCTPQAKPFLPVPQSSGPPEKFQLGKPINLYSSTLASIFSDPTTKQMVKIGGAVSDYASKMLEQGSPLAASSLQGVSVIVGGYGALERLLKPEKYTRWQIGLALADFALAIINFLGKFIPAIKNLSSWFLGVKCL